MREARRPEVATTLPPRTRRHASSRGAAFRPRAARFTERPVDGQPDRAAPRAARKRCSARRRACGHVRDARRPRSEGLHVDCHRSAGDVETGHVAAGAPGRMTNRTDNGHRGRADPQPGAGSGDRPRHAEGAAAGRRRRSIGCLDAPGYGTRTWRIGAAGTYGGIFDTRSSGLSKGSALLWARSWGHARVAEARWIARACGGGMRKEGVLRRPGGTRWPQHRAPTRRPRGRRRLAAPWAGSAWSTRTGTATSCCSTYHRADGPGRTPPRGPRGRSRDGPGSRGWSPTSSR